MTTSQTQVSVNSPGGAVCFCTAVFVYNYICAFICEIMAFVNLLEVFEEDLERINFFADEIDSEDYESEDEQRSLKMVEFYGRRVDIFDIFDDGKIYETFRFQKETIVYIASLIEDKIGRKTARKKSFSVVEQVLVALHFFATGTFQTVIGNVLHVSQPSASRIIHNVSLALCEIASDHIYFPQSEYEIQEVSEIPHIFLLCSRLSSFITYFIFS